MTTGSSARTRRSPAWASVRERLVSQTSRMKGGRLRRAPRRSRKVFCVLLRCPSWLARLLGASRADGGLHVLALLGRRQHGLHAKGLDPQLTRPPLRVVEVLVFL